MESKFNSPFWILGNSISGIKSINWIGGDHSSFANCNTLIVDLTTLSDQILSAISSDRVREISDEIRKRYNAGGNIICILQESKVIRKSNWAIDNYFWSPIKFSISKINQGKGIQADPGCQFPKYLDKIEFWKFTASPSHQVTVWGKMINPNKEVLGGLYSLIKPEGAGKFLSLPPQDDPSESLSILLESLNIFEKTPPPSWIENIQIPGEIKIRESIETIQKEITNSETAKKNEEKKLNELIRYKKLLYSTDNELENIVIDSLNLIGFSNVRGGRSPEKEDALFDFDLDDFDLGVIEVKGKTKKVELADFRQTDDWAWDYRNEGKKVKAILIATCFRLEDTASSTQKRMSFEDHQEYIEQHKIAVLPTWTLFKLVEYKLKGNKLDIKKFEKVLSESNKVLKFEDFIDEEK